MRNSIRPTARHGRGRGGSFAYAVFVTIGLALAAGCQPRQPAAPSSPGPLPSAIPTTPDLVVPPTHASTNEQRHVTYTFNLPRPATGGYVIQESLDGVSWTDLGRSTSTNFTRVTFVDSTPSSGKYYRVILP